MNEQNTTLILVAFSLIILSLSIYIIWWSYAGSVLLTQEFMMDIYVQNRGGINIDTDAIHFGIAMPGGSATRPASRISPRIRPPR